MHLLASLAVPAAHLLALQLLALRLQIEKGGRTFNPLEGLGHSKPLAGMDGAHPPEDPTAV